MKPVKENTAEIYAVMNKTRDFRRQFIEHDKPTVTLILQAYPRFLDINYGRLVSFLLHKYAATV